MISFHTDVGWLTACGIFSRYTSYSMKGGEKMIKRTITTGIATAAIMFGTIAPAAFADSSFVISGNGSRSQNSITSDTSNTMIVSQSNDTRVNNDVSVSNDTGGNSASGNTGGGVSLRSGDASADVIIHNMAGSNVADIGNSCGCESGNVDAIIAGNGSRSDNSIDTSNNHYFLLNQQTNTDFDNNVDIDNSTGNNDVSDNTGGSSFWNNNFPWWMQNQHDMDWWKTHNMGDWNNWNSSNGGTTAFKSGNADATVLIHNMGSENIAY
jgi:hypothetical protein